MSATDGEKLIILMLAELHEHLGVASRVSKKQINSAIQFGDTWSLLDAYEHGPAASDWQQVHAILVMWSIIESSAERLNSDDKFKLQAACPFWGKFPQFPGFDHWEHNDYDVIADRMIKNESRFNRFKDRDLSSQIKWVSEGYVPMLPLFWHQFRHYEEDIFPLDPLINLLNLFELPEQPVSFPQLGGSS